MAGSQRELAERLGRGGSTVRHWLDHPAWPFPRTPPYNVAAIEAWAALTFGRPGVEDPLHDLGQAKRRADLALTLERRAKLKLERETREGTLHDAAACLERRLTQLARFRSALSRLPRMIRRRLTGQTEAVIERRLAEALDQVLRELAAEVERDRPAKMEHPPAAPGDAAKKSRPAPRRGRRKPKSRRTTKGTG